MRIDPASIGNNYADWIRGLSAREAFVAQFRSRQTKSTLSCLTDIYGLGAVLYAILAGKPPFRCDSVLETLEQVAARRVPSRRATWAIAGIATWRRSASSAWRRSPAGVTPRPKGAGRRPGALAPRRADRRPSEPAGPSGPGDGADATRWSRASAWGDGTARRRGGGRPREHERNQ